MCHYLEWHRHHPITTIVGSHRMGSEAENVGFALAAEGRSGPETLTEYGVHNVSVPE